MQNSILLHTCNVISQIWPISNSVFLKSSKYTHTTFLWSPFNTEKTTIFKMATMRTMMMMTKMASSSSSSSLTTLCRVSTILYLKQTMFLGYTVLQLFYIYSLCYMQCYFTCEICFVLLHLHFPQFMWSAQYGCFLYFLKFVLFW